MANPHQRQTRPAKLLLACLLLGLTQASSHLNQALPHPAHRSSQPPDCLAPDHADCKPADEDEDDEDTSRDVSNDKLPAEVIGCLTSCANCVKQWRAGVYNGRWCARDCLHQLTTATGPLSDTLDPDCSLIKYFNATILASLM